MALVKKYPAEVVAVEQPIEGVYILTLKSLKGAFKFYPGQFLHLALEEYDPSGQWPDSRCFSMQSPPDTDTLKISYAVKGEFTQKMARLLKPGVPVTVKLPYGELFTQQHNKKNTVFISGGTGITPFLSLFNHESFAQYEAPVLVAGFKSQELNIFSKELALAKEINPGLRLWFFYEDDASSGMINIEEVAQQTDPDTSLFISGPPAMISFFKKRLLELGRTASQIKTDDWE